MKTILVISDSVEGTPFDLKRTTNTIKGYEMDPLLVVPAIFERSGNHFVNPSEEVMEYAFGPDCSVDAVSIGYLTEPGAIECLSRHLRTAGKGKYPIIYQPSLITDDGEILVSEDFYYSICDNLMDCVDLVIVNRFEAELLSEIECQSEGDFSNAAREISKQFKCSVLIRHISDNDNKNLLFNGVSTLWINTPPHLIAGADKRYNLMSAVACCMAEKPLIGTAIRNAIYRCSIDKNKPDDLQYMQEDEVEYIDVSSSAVSVSEPEIASEAEEILTAEPIEEPIEEPLETPIEEKVEEVTAEQVSEPVNAAEPVVEPEIQEEKTVNEVKETEVKAVMPAVSNTGRVSASAAIAAAKSNTGILGVGFNRPLSGSILSRTSLSGTSQSGTQAASEPRKPLTSTPVPSFSANSILGSKSIIPAAPSQVTASPANTNTTTNTTTSSLVSPVKTLRDIARQFDVNHRDGEETTAVTSTIEKPAPGPKAPISELRSKESSVLQLQALRDRLNNMTGSGQS